MTHGGAWYNENDEYAADWLERLIAGGHIAPGVVDRRDIRDVRPGDLLGHTQVHLFAGIGIWSAALRDAGVSDDTPWWSASCPCQPFSQAGQGGGFDDERHLWPAAFHLIRECRPVRIVGEQVASKNGLAWFDLVSADLEGEGYTIGATDTCAAGFGAPHIRQRLYWAAERLPDSTHEQHDGAGFGRPGRWIEHSDGGAARLVADAADTGQQRRRAGEACDGRDTPRLEFERLCDAGRLADADGGDAGAEGIQRGRQHGQQPQDGRACDGAARPSPVNGFWRDADWLHCRDDKWRPVEAGTFPLAHGEQSRVGKLRAYGNQIVRPQAAEFIAAYLEHDAVLSVA